VKLCSAAVKLCSAAVKLCSAAAMLCSAAAKLCSAAVKLCSAAAMLCSAAVKLCSAAAKLCSAAVKLCSAAVKLCSAAVKLCSAAATLCSAAATLCSAAAKLCSAAAKLCSAALGLFALTAHPCPHSRTLAPPARRRIPALRRGSRNALRRHGRFRSTRCSRLPVSALGKEDSPVRKRQLVRTLLEEGYLEPLVRRTLAGDAKAWGELWLAIDPVVEEIARRWRVMSRLADREDDCRNVVVRVMGRLRENGFERLALFHAVLLRREGAARAWLSALATRSALDYVTAHPERAGSAERPWVTVVPLPEGLEEQLPVSMRAVQMADVRRVLAYVERALPAPERRALYLWCGGHADCEIAAELGIEEAAADQLVRAVVRRLRRGYTRSGGSPRRRK
jgi:DNA-directed RNA polymerase specialized sigma24 family protein